MAAVGVGLLLSPALEAGACSCASFGGPGKRSWPQGQPRRHKAGCDLTLPGGTELRTLPTWVSSSGVKGGVAGPARPLCPLASSSGNDGRGSSLPQGPPPPPALPGTCTGRGEGGGKEKGCPLSPLAWPSSSLCKSPPCPPFLPSEPVHLGHRPPDSHPFWKVAGERGSEGQGLPSRPE